MSLRAKIEAVIYAAEEPVTLAQLAAIFAQELPPRKVTREDLHAETSEEPHKRPSVLTLIERGFAEAGNYGFDADLAEVTLLHGLDERGNPNPASNAASAAQDEAEAKRFARQREREIREQLQEIVDDLIGEYAKGDRGMEIREVAGGYRIATKPEYHDAVRSFVKSLKPPMKLSLQALETLAVIAYKQPVTAPEVSEIRGVDSGGVLGSLMSRKLITTAGRKQVIGRPILYKTTREFLLRFGLKDINELPSIEEFEKLAGDLEIADSSSPSEETMLPFDATIAGAQTDPEEAWIAVETTEESLSVTTEITETEVSEAPVEEPSHPPVPTGKIEE